MALDPKYSYAAVNAAQNAISTALNSGKMRVYQSSGSPPTNADDSANGTLLAELTLNSTFAPSASNGVLTANTITSDSSADAAGTADYFRLWNSGVTTCYFQGTAGIGATYNYNMDNNVITLGAVVACTGLTLTLPRE